MKVDWDNLKLLLHVSRNPILSEASQGLGQDATTISRKLKKLEAELGISLFERTRRGHILTPEAIEIVQQAELMEQSILQISTHAQTENTIAGQVRLAVTEGFGNYFIAPEIGKFAIQHPNIALYLIAIPGYANVTKREADMAITLSRPQKGRLKVRKLTDYQLNLYSTDTYLSQHPDIETTSDLSKHTLIGYMDELLYSDQLSYYHEALPGLKPTLCSPSIVAQMQMTRAGAGIAVLPRFMAKQHSELIPILEDQICIYRTFWLTIHENMHSLARIKAVSAFLSSLVQSQQHLLLK